MDGSAIGQSWLSSVLSILPGGEETQPAQSVAVWSEGTAVRPVRAVVTSPHGRSGIQYDQESVERLFSSFANPLSDALAGCSAPEQTTAAKFQAALGSKNPGVYLDFLGGVPLADLSAWHQRWARAQPGADRHRPAAAPHRDRRGRRGAVLYQ